MIRSNALSSLLSMVDVTQTTGTRRRMMLNIAAASAAAVVMSGGVVRADMNVWNGVTNFSWSASAANWSLGPYFWDNQYTDTANFNGAATGTITVDSAINLRAIAFNANGYTIGGANTLTFLNAGTGLNVGEINVTSSVTAIINAVLAGSQPMSKTGNGTLILGGTNTYSAGMTVAGGTLQIGNGGTTGTLGTGSVTLGGGTSDIPTLRINRSTPQTISNSINIDAAPSAYTRRYIDIPGSGVVTLSGVITGASTNSELWKTGTGTLVLSNAANSIAGSKVIEQGVLEVADMAALTGAGNVFLGGNTTATFRYSGSADASTAKLAAFALQGTNSTIEVTGAGKLTISSALGDFDGTHGFTKAGAGTLILTNANYYGGPTIISAGTLQVGDGGTGGSIPADITNNAALVFNRSDNSTYAGVISGPGQITKAGAGTLTLTANNTFTGALNVSNGTLSTSGDLSPDSMTVTATTPNTAAFNQTGGTNTVAAVAIAESAGSNGAYSISGGTLTAGGFIFVGSAGNGTLTQSGGTVTSSSILSIGVNIPDATGTYTISSGQLNANGSFFDVGAAGNGTLTQSGGTVSVTASNGLRLAWFSSVTGNYALNGGTLVASNINKGAGTANFDFNGGTLRASVTSSDLFSNFSPTINTGGAIIDTNGFNPTISSALIHKASLGATFDGGLTKNGLGTLTLTANNTFTGPMKVTAGQLSISGDLSPSTLTVADAASNVASMSQTAGNAIVRNDISVGNLAGSNGTYSLSAGMLKTTNGNTVIGRAATSTGTFTQTGGTHELIGASTGILAVGAGGTGTYNLSGGILNTRVTNIGETGAGTFIQSGGTHTINNQFVIAFNPASTSTYTLTNGQFNSNGTSCIIGISGSGTFTQSGGTATLSAGTGVQLSSTVASTGNYNLNGGTLIASKILKGSGTANFDFNGGTLRAAVDTTNLFSNFSPTINTGGAIIDTDGFNATISSALIHKASLGATPDGGLAKTSSGTLTLAAASTYTGPTSVSGGGKLVTNFAIKNTAALNISGNGTFLEIPTNGGVDGVTRVGSLTIGNGAKIDLHDNDLIIHNGAGTAGFNAIKALFTSGKIFSSTPAPGTTFGIVENSSGGITTLSGYAIPTPTTATLVKYTWSGDANLDGVVDGTDYALTDSGFAGSGNKWALGDYNYSGNVDGTDYALIDTGFGSQSGTLPEPTTLGLIGLGAMTMLRRRRCVTHK